MTDTTNLPDNTLASPRADALSGARVADFWALLKPGVMRLVVFTGLCGLLIAPGTLHPFLAAVAVLCIAVGAGAAGAINMWYERDIDALMARTRQRPVVRGRISPDDALAFGVVLSLASVAVMGLAVNWAAAALLALANGFYVFVYTMVLKRRTPQNIVIGGAAGAFPPMIGWAAVTGDIAWCSVILFGIIFFWTPPHFWALSLFACKDYEKAGVPMLPVTHGEAHTKRQILFYSVLLLPLGVLPTIAGTAGWVYGTGALLLSGLMVLGAIQVLRERGTAAARRLFAYSIVYLFALFALLVIDATHGPFGQVLP